MSMSFVNHNYVIIICFIFGKYFLQFFYKVVNVSLSQICLVTNITKLKGLTAQQQLLRFNSWYVLQIIQFLNCLLLFNFWCLCRVDIEVFLVLCFNVFFSPSSIEISS